MKKLQFPLTADSWKEVAVDLFFELFGSFIIAFALQNLALSASFPMTGVSGIAMIVYRLFGLPIGWVTVALNIPVAILCYRWLGRAFLIKSIRCMLISSLMIDYVAPLLPAYSGSRMLSAIAVGVLLGIGYAVIYMRRSSTGGSDFIIMAAKAHWPHLQLGSIAFVCDFMVVIAGAWIFRDADGLIYAFVVSCLTAIVIDKVMLGLNSGKVGLVVTNNGAMICDVIDDCVKRGSTILDGRGGYKKDAKQVVMVACSPKEMYQIERAVKAADRDAFIIIVNSSEVHGQGFRVI